MEKKKDMANIKESIVTMDFSKLTTMQIVKLIIAGIFLVIFIIAFIQNFDSVIVKFLFWDISISISLLILLSVVIGAIIAIFREERKIHKKNKIIKSLQLKINELEKVK